MNQGPAAIRCFRQGRGSRASDCAKGRSLAVHPGKKEEMSIKNKD